MTKNISDYIDNFGRVCTLEMDGGDTCSHESSILYGYHVIPDHHAIPANYRFDAVDLFTDIEILDGRYVRHPDTSKWYSEIDCLSRDQFTPLLCLLGLLARYNSIRLRHLFKAHLWRGLLFAWNTRRNGMYPTLEEHQAKNTVDAWDYSWKLPDITGPEIWACWIRALRVWPLYPMLVIFDIQTLLGSTHRRYFTTDSLQMNQVVITDYSTRIMPTPTSLLARWIYGKKIARAALTKEYGDYLSNPPVHQYLLPLVESWPVRE